MNASAYSLRTEHFTALFEKARTGDRLAAGMAYRFALPRLRRIAGGLLRYHRSHHTLQATALVSELYLKFHGAAVRIEDREHFFRIAARAMHQVLTDRGRSQKARKARVARILEEMKRDCGIFDPDTAGAVREALSQFEEIDPDAARIVRLHYLEGHTWEEVSSLVKRPVWKVRYDAEFALDWMRGHI